MFAILLTGAGYKVTMAVDDFDALLQLRKKTPDILISNMNMPKISGLGILSAVPQHFPAAPVIAASAACEPGKELSAGVIVDAHGKHQADYMLAAVTELLSTDISTKRHQV